MADSPREPFHECSMELGHFRVEEPMSELFHIGPSDIGFWTGSPSWPVRVPWLGKTALHRIACNG